MFYYVILCLFDITDTGVLQYRADQQNLFSRNQHRNWQVLQQLMSLRAQPITIFPVQNKIVDLDDYEFGNIYTGQHRVWATGFAIEPTELYLYENNPNYWLEYDFDSVPIIAGLNETVKFDVPCIRSHGSGCNILFYTGVGWQNADFKFHNIE